MQEGEGICHVIVIGMFFTIINITHGVLASATTMGELEEALLFVVVVVTFTCDDEENNLELIIEEVDAASPLRKRIS